MATTEDTEITLGVGKLLGLFFLLAAICGVFFSIGYSLGRGSGREQAANDQVSAAPDATPTNSAIGGKPSAAVAAKAESQATTPDSAPQTPLTFYKSVQQNNSGQQGEAEKRPATAESAAVRVATPTAPAVAAVSAPAAATPVTGPGTIVVQVAALSREDDAVSLAGALRKKSYNVFVVNNPVNNDKFYHVQVGPFATMAEAQAMKAKLVAEGYNPILKK